MSSATDFFSIDTREFEAQMRGAMQALPREREIGMTAVMLKAEAAVKERFAPWDTGELAGSVTGEALEGGELGELRTNGVEYAAAQEFDHEFDHSHNPGPTGERGADYIGRGIRYADAIAPEIWQRMHEEVWRNAA